MMFLDIFPDGETLKNMQDLYKIHLISAHTFMKVEQIELNRSTAYSAIRPHFAALTEEDVGRRLLLNEPLEQRYYQWQLDPERKTATLEMLKDYIQRGSTLNKNGTELIFAINRHRAWQIVKECAEKQVYPGWSILRLAISISRLVQNLYIHSKHSYHLYKLQSFGREERNHPPPTTINVVAPDALTVSGSPSSTNKSTGQTFSLSISISNPQASSITTSYALSLPSGYSASGDVSGELVYVNYGVPADYESLAALGIDVKGRIVIARYGGSWRGIKPKVAAEHGALACLIYSDPHEDGYYQAMSTRRARGGVGA
jgi:hypothetical protein